MVPTLRITHAWYSDAELERWKQGTYSLVKDCAKPLKRILRQKAHMRPGRRFFGEAKVAATTEHDEAWYGSFKWLTSARWCSSQKPMSGYQAKFRDALLKHFPDLCDFQQLVAAAVPIQRGRKPVGPDLWLITPDRHRFIEVKLPGDRVAQRQLLGLALIGEYLRSDRPISVEIVHLYAGVEPGSSEELQREFKAICEALQRSRISQPVRPTTARRNALRGAGSRKRNAASR